ncbi:rhomboid family intramembrane serine protease [Paracoccus aerodenitrificans]|uniref:rhomboid family intramembrane serine protease n=1 Tax=Paracoccus aerodenitrificans TaxID=3017781 RepID=UPI0022F05AC7|nr:rhomboid family intramembrane serine protease [Paracoccus aerodenitrificans]WBU63667.1 rhomboid family intramembrane serine protease [Paracoccus aerodenitrificans]
MRPGYDESPINALPAVVWVLVLPMIAAEIVFGLGAIGMIGGAQGVGMRLNALQMTAYFPELPVRMWQLGVFDARQAARILSYPFVHGSVTHALFVIVFALALGKMVAEQFRPWAFLMLFFGASIGGAVAYTLFGFLTGINLNPLIGGYPGVYGLIGAFTFLIWVRLGIENANRMKAFTLIGVLLVFQLVFGLISRYTDYGWVAEIAGFAIGFLLCFLLVPGGWRRALNAIRQR